MSGGGERLKDEGTRTQVVVAGAFAGLVSRFCIAPLDVLKIRLQLQTGVQQVPLPLRDRGLPSFHTINTLQNIARDEGITAFWKGNISAELLYITYGAVQFSAYRFSTRLLQPLGLPRGIEEFMSGAAAGASATTLTYPLDLLRTRFAAQGPQKVYTSLRGGVSDIAHQEGFKGFYRGISTAIAQIVPYMGLFFCTYEALRPTLSSMMLPLNSGDAASGLLASICAKTGSFPLDLIRKRLQIQGPSRDKYGEGRVPVYNKGAWRTGKAIVAHEGLRGLYRGLSVGLFKSAPASAVTMWTYERALSTLSYYDRGFR